LLTSYCTEGAHILIKGTDEDGNLDKSEAAYSYLLNVSHDSKEGRGQDNLCTAKLIIDDKHIDSSGNTASDCAGDWRRVIEEKNQGKVYYISAPMKPHYYTLLVTSSSSAYSPCFDNVILEKQSDYLNDVLKDESSSGGDNNGNEKNNQNNEPNEPNNKEKKNEGGTNVIETLQPYDLVRDGHNFFVISSQEPNSLYNLSNCNLNQEGEENILNCSKESKIDIKHAGYSQIGVPIRLIQDKDNFYILFVDASSKKNYNYIVKLNKANHNSKAILIAKKGVVSDIALANTSDYNLKYNNKAVIYAVLSEGSTSGDSNPKIIHFYTSDFDENNGEELKGYEETDLPPSIGDGCAPSSIDIQHTKGSDRSTLLYSINCNKVTNSNYGNNKKSVIFGYTPIIGEDVSNIILKSYPAISLENRVRKISVNSEGKIAVLTYTLNNREPKNSPVNLYILPAVPTDLPSPTIENKMIKSVYFYDDNHLYYTEYTDKSDSGKIGLINIK
ncbi:MAG: hypothetical protein GWP09_02450, partial [Nitrospiraceae bacterium]|nr:hypothetical protein [Nitrospiraceae bacterium]